MNKHGLRLMGCALILGFGGIPVACSSGGPAPSNASVGTTGAGSDSCATGQVRCNGVCTSTLSDISNCGACGQSCGTGQVCSAGACACTATDLDICGASCTNLQSDGANCGSCGNVCPTDTLCSLGQCSSSCGAGLTECGASCADTNTDINHCGGCNQPCSAGRECTAGTCTCTGGLTECSGACTDTATDASNCGSCANACASGSCSGGQCAVVETDGGLSTSGTGGVASTTGASTTDQGMGGSSTTGANSTTSADSTSSGGSGGASTTGGGTTTDNGGDSGTGGAPDGGVTDGGTTDGGTTTGGEVVDDLNSGENTMGWIGCSMGENTAIGYKRIGGTRMWGSNGNGGAVVQQFTDTNSAGWQRFDSAAAQYGKPVAVWIMICIFAQAGATAQEVNQMIENAREHSAPGVVIYLTGQPLYFEGHTCTLAGTGGPESTDQLAQQVAAQHDDVIYPGSFILQDGEVQSDSCHANSQGEDSLGRQARAFWGQP